MGVAPTLCVGHQTLRSCRTSASATERQNHNLNNTVQVLAIGLSLLMSVASMDARGALVCTVKSFKGSANGIVTRPGKSSEFYSLMRNKLYDEAIQCCVSCIVSAGTKIVITDQGFASHTIRVIEGPFRGCVGDLPTEYVGNCN